MGIEIERKFLLASDDWRAAVTHSEQIAQGYLVGTQAIDAGNARASVRVRISGEQAWLNIKAVKLGIARTEFEYPIPRADAETLLNELCDGVLEKIRHHVPVQNSLFEIDEFLGDNFGLVVAEVELPSLDADWPRPSWLGAEVSTLARYYNVKLIDHPYAKWSADERLAVDATPLRGASAC